MLKIQIIEDDRALSDGIMLALSEPGTEFFQSGDIKGAKEIFEKSMPQIVILDINLPDGSGYDFLTWVRKSSQIPVLILTANDMETDEVTGLTLGADDYVTKPFSLAVLRARIKALIRRVESMPENVRGENVYEEDEFSFDFEKLVFHKGGREILLSVNEQRLLRILTENRGCILSRDLLVDRLWGDGGEYVDENALSVTVNRLRGKLADKEGAASFIQTVYGQGYMWKKTDAEK